MVKGQYNLVALLFHALVLRTMKWNTHTVLIGQSPSSKATTDIHFVLGMNVFAFTDINDDGFTGVRKLRHSHRLSFTKFGPVAFSRVCNLILEVGQLNPVKRKVALTPFFAPVGDHQREQIAILISSAGIAFALIPDGSANRVAKVRLQDAVVDVGRTRIAAHLSLQVFQLLFLIF